MKCISSWFVIIAVILIVIWVGFQRTHAPDTQNTAQLPVGPGTEQALNAQNDTAQQVALMIEVTNPTHNGAITSPLTVKGRARGPWYFEASFPVELRNSSGTVIATAVAEAQGDWMTTDWVPFIATLNYPPQTV